MEFSRTADEAPEISLAGSLNTYYSGGRCDAEEFQVINSFIGEYNTGLKVYPILDGCSVMGLSDKLYFKFTYNTYASLYELTVMDAEMDNVLWIYYGSKEDDAITLRHNNNGEYSYANVNLKEHSFKIDYHDKEFHVNKSQ